MACVPLIAQVLFPARRVAATPLSTPSIVYLFTEDFEGPGYEHSWTETITGSSDINDQFNSPALAGSFSLLTSNAVGAASTRTLGALTTNGLGEVWGYFLLRPITILASEALIFDMQTNGAAQFSIRITGSGGNVKIRQSGSAQATTVNGVSAGVTYGVWFYFKKATSIGANDGIASVGFSTDGIEPTSGNNFAEYTTGAEVNNVADVTCGSLASITQAYIFDKIRLADVPIGDNPP